DIVEAFGVDPSRIRLVPGGVGPPFRPRPDLDGDWVRATVGIGPGPFLLCVGKLSKRRNIAALITAAGSLTRQGFPHGLVLVGTNYLGLPIADLARSAGARVAHLEYVPDELLVGLYNEADLLVQAAVYEPFSLPVLEAMACGLPVVASASPGLRATAGAVARYAEDVSATGLAASIAGALGDRSFRSEAAGAGPRRAAEFSWAAQATRMAACLVEAHERDT
ncbi:MAG: glycosyltransferase, partial [Phenylobacterium sp.]